MNGLLMGLVNVYAECRWKGIDM